MEQSFLLISKQKTIRSVKHLWLMLKKFISCLINNNEKDVTKKVQLFYMPYQFGCFLTFVYFVHLKTNIFMA